MYSFEIKYKSQIIINGTVDKKDKINMELLI